MYSTFFTGAAAVLLSFLSTSVHGLSMQGVTLEGGGHFAQLHSSSRLLCGYTLDEGQELQKLGWFRAGVPLLTWAPPAEPVASVEFRGRLDLTAGDGSLNVTTVEVDDAGPYTCTVQSGDGQQESSEEYNVAVADVPSYGFSMKGNVADCQLHFSFTSPPIFPKPSPLCGVWSTDTLYTGTATNWQAVPYYNGSVAYSIVNTTFPVRGMPLQAGIRCEMSFPPKAGASEDDRIIAWQNTAYYPQVSERGCPPLEVGDNMQVQYTNHRATCRAELALQDTSKQLVAMISCISGKKSSLRGGGMGSLQLQCVRAQWEPVGGVSWAEFEDMECYDDIDGSPQREHEHKSLDMEDAVVLEVTGGATSVASSAALLIALYIFKYITG